MKLKVGDLFGREDTEYSWFEILDLEYNDTLVVFRVINSLKRGEGVQLWCLYEREAVVHKFFREDFLATIECHEYTNMSHVNSPLWKSMNETK